MNQGIPNQAQDKVMQFQSLQSQLQVVASQKQQFSIKVKDIDNAIDELGKMEKGKIYKSAGPLMMETSMEKSKKNLEEEKENAEARLKILESQEKKMSEKLKELGSELQSMMKSQGGGPTGG